MSSVARILRPQARNEIEAAKFWYESRQPGLGDRFWEAVRKRIDDVFRDASKFAAVSGSIRAAPVKGFEYVVYYRARPDEIVVVAVMHGRRNPRAWKYRR